MHFILYFYFLFLFKYCICTESNDFCDINEPNGICTSDSSSALNARYLFYNVNPPEGFNLRRDVYMRIAVLAKNLNKKHKNWYLVLPPWPHLYHWQSKDIQEQDRLPWSLFFNVKSLATFAPVVEMSEFLQTGQTSIDQVYVLQHFEDTFTTGNFNDRMKIEPCQNQLLYEREEDEEFHSERFWGYSNVTAKEVKCLSFHGHASQLMSFIEETKARTIMFDHFEVALHDRFGDKTYWDVRKSMKFSDHLIKEANKYRKNNLNSSDETDDTFPSKERKTKGGNYVCAHLRRKDFVRARRKEVPSAKEAAKQIDDILKQSNLDRVFVATDASKQEKRELKSLLSDKRVLFYVPSSDVKEKYKDGGIAIIEQIICSHARKFIGTHESTFSFRIQEEREIMGFPAEDTFVRFCGDEESKCKKPSKWTIVH